MYRIIYPPTVQFHYLYQRPQQILNAFSKLGYESIFYSIGNENGSGITSPTPNLVVVPHSMIKDYPIIYNPKKKTVLWVSYPVSAPRHIQEYPHDILVFDAIDAPFDEFEPWCANYDIVRRQANVVFTTSRALYNFNIDYHPHMLPNGSDYAHFDLRDVKVTPPPELENILKLKTPIITYIGAIATWLDWGLIKAIAAMRPQYHFVMIGPLYGMSHKTVVHGPNITYLGAKDYVDLPKFLKYTNVCINPFALTQMTMGVDPIKIYEYMASGKPIVSTPLPDLFRFNECLHLAIEPSDFVAKLDSCVKYPNKGINERIRTAQDNSWITRAQSAIEVLNDLSHNIYLLPAGKPRPAETTIVETSYRQVERAVPPVFKRNYPHWRRV